MNFKPENLYISVIDLFSVFIPGGIATIVIYHNFGDFVQDTFVIDTDSINYSWAIVLLYAYILGHFINRMGSKFDDWFYDNWKHKFPQDYKNAVINLIGGDSDAKYIASTFTRAKYRVIHSGSPIIHKIEKEMADSKFFRSLLVISLCLIVLYLVKGLWVLLGLSVLLSLFSCWLYFKLRYQSTVTTYKYIIFLEAMKDKSDVQEGDTIN